MPRCGYHNARKREPSKRSRANEQLLDQMIAIHSHRHTRRYGSPRMTCELRALGIACSENRVARIMRSRACELVPGVLSPEDYPAQSRGPSFAQSAMPERRLRSAFVIFWDSSSYPGISAGTFRSLQRRIPAGIYWTGGLVLRNLSPPVLTRPIPTVELITRAFAQLIRYTSSLRIGTAAAAAIAAAAFHAATCDDPTWHKRCCIDERARDGTSGHCNMLTGSAAGRGTINIKPCLVSAFERIN